MVRPRYETVGVFNRPADAAKRIIELGLGFVPYRTTKIWHNNREAYIVQFTPKSLADIERLKTLRTKR